MLGEQMLQKKQIYPILHSEGGENALISRQDLFEHWHLCRRCFRGGCRRCEKNGRGVTPWDLVLPWAYLSTGPFFTLLCFGAGITLRSTQPLPPRTGSPPEPSRWSPTRPIRRISSLWTSSCFQR